MDTKLFLRSAQPYTENNETKLLVKNINLIFFENKFKAKKKTDRSRNDVKLNLLFLKISSILFHSTEESSHRRKYHRIHIAISGHTHTHTQSI